MVNQSGLGLDEVLLVPSASEVLPNEINITTQISNQLTLSIPVIGAPDFTTLVDAKAFAKEGTLGILPSELATVDNIKSIKAENDDYMVGAVASTVAEVDQLVQANIDVVELSTDTDDKTLADIITEIKATQPSLPLWVGPVATLDTAKHVLAAGADTIVIGSTKTTPVTKALTTTMAFAELASEYDASVILGSDIKYSGDVVKALAAGAVAVMVDKEIITNVIADNIFQISGGLRSGMGYTGSSNVEMLRKGAQFVQITDAGLVESHPHDVVLTKDAPNYARR